MSQDAPPGPHSLVDAKWAMQAAMAARDAERAAAERRRKRNRAIGLVVALAFVGALVYGGKQYFDFISESAATKAFPPEERVPIETAQFRFVMPTTPAVQPLDLGEVGPFVSGTHWSVESGNLMLIVVAIDVGVPIDAGTAQAGFDSAINSMTGSDYDDVVSNESFTLGDVFGRSIVLDEDGSHLFIEAYAKGTWVVMIGGSALSSDRPVTYDDLVESFSFN